MSTPRSALTVLLAGALALAACAKSPPRVPARAGADARSQALIDSGNVAFRAGEYEDAARRYASATVAMPGDPAAWYGLGMALAKLGRDDEARTAYAKARALSVAAVADSADDPRGAGGR